MLMDGKKNACENKGKYPLSPPIETVTVEFDRHDLRDQDEKLREETRHAGCHQSRGSVVFGSRGEIPAILRQRVSCIAYLLSSSREFVWIRRRRKR